MKENILRAYERIGELTPLMNDCGALCGAACCQTDDDDRGGVYLFPGEKEMLQDCGWGKIIRDSFGPMLVCDGPCDREKRPLGCRIFPLTPVRGKNGKWTVRIDVRARPVCPLVSSGISGMDPEFVRAARDALRIIAESDEGEAFIEKWAKLEEDYRKPLW